jgi:hypothetical protein
MLQWINETQAKNKVQAARETQAVIAVTYKLRLSCKSSANFKLKQTTSY